MKLYQFPLSPNSRRVVAVLKHLQIPCELQTIDLSKREQLAPDFIQLNPNHKLPTLVDGDFVLWESNAIMQYLCSKVAHNTLYPTDPVKQADINRWLFWQTAHWGSACGILIFERIIKPAFKLGEPDIQEVAKGEELVHRFASVLEAHLQGREWLVGDNLTLADYAVGSFLDLAAMAQFPLAPYSEIPRWYRQIEQLPAWKSSSPHV